MLDSRPFEDLHHIVEEFQDDRIWVFAEWVRVLLLAQRLACALPAALLLRLPGSDSAVTDSSRQHLREACLRAWCVGAVRSVSSACRRPPPASPTLAHITHPSLPTVPLLHPLRSPPASQIDKQFTPKQGVEWAPGYHGTLYNLTDDAIQVRVVAGCGAGRRMCIGGRQAGGLGCSKVENLRNQT